MKESKAVPNETKPVRGKYLTIKGAVKYLDSAVGKDWFYRHMENRTLPFRWFLLGPGKRVMDSADIDDWVRTREISPGKLPGDMQGGLM